jgi:hypothetical protein
MNNNQSMKTPTILIGGMYDVATANIRFADVAAYLRAPVWLLVTRFRPRH